MLMWLCVCYAGDVCCVVVVVCVVCGPKGGTGGCTIIIQMKNVKIAFYCIEHVTIFIVTYS